MGAFFVEGQKRKGIITVKPHVSYQTRKEGLQSWMLGQYYLSLKLERLPLLEAGRLPLLEAGKITSL
jgi:hypothetical protein